MKTYIAKSIPWFITALAIYYVANGIEWAVLKEYLLGAHYSYLLIAFAATTLSYVIRARRWQFLFPDRTLHYLSAYRVLILGFFMNNILPARSGEFVRAHMGAKIAGAKRTLVLATIATERLADGLMLSLMFLPFAFSISDHRVVRSMLYVAAIFGIGALGVAATLLFRDKLFSGANRLHSRLGWRITEYGSDRLQVFLSGLAPLFKAQRFPILVLGSCAVWLVELTVYIAVAHAYGISLSLAQAVIFLVAVNFSSLIPAAPGGIGVIEAIASKILLAAGITANLELALAMVLSQHIIQYVAVGIPGAVVMVSSSGTLPKLSAKSSGPPRLKNYNEAVGANE